MLLCVVALAGLTVVFRVQAELDQQAKQYVKQADRQGVARLLGLDHIDDPSEPGHNPASLPDMPGTDRSVPASAPAARRDIPDLTGSFSAFAYLPAHANASASMRLPTEPMGRLAPDVMPAGRLKAVTVRVRNAEIAGDVAPPERRVDVVLTRRFDSSSMLSDVVVQNARVLAVDANLDAGGAEDAPTRAVTLEVDMAGAQKLVLASQAGILSLVWRNAEDREASQTRQISIADFTGMATTGAAVTGATAKVTAPADAPDRERLKSITVNRVGAGPTVYWVPRE
jgi:Flp pilus assembly protein CpaB